MDNNELNNNINTDLGSQIMMGNNEPITNTNQNLEQSSINMNQSVNPVIQNNLNNQQQTVQELQNESVDSIFSDMQPANEEPIQPVVTESVQNSSISTKEKKGKGPIIIIILLILIILGLSGYIAYDKFFTKEESTTKDVTPTKQKEKKVLLEDANQEVVYASIDEKHEGKVKRVPYINIDSKYAKEINDEIDSMVKKGLDGQAPDMSYTVDYQFYINDDIVSIKFSWETEGSQTFSKIYNINQYTGEKVTNLEILSQANIEENDLNNKMVEAYKTARPLESIEGNTDNLVKDCYQKDIDALTNGKIKGMYLSNNNELNVLFDINYVAGAGVGEAILNVTGNKVLLNPALMQ